MKALAMALIAGSLGFLLAGCERSLIYYPSQAPEAQLERLADAAGLRPWRNLEGERIGWRSVAGGLSGKRVAFLVFHGNAGHAAQRAYYARGLEGNVQEGVCDVYLLEYPGYGSRAGKPSESAIKEAARSAAEQLLQGDYEALYLVGESLGSGVACHIAATSPEAIDGLLLVTPFTSLPDIAKRHYPSLLVSALLSERYDNVQALEKYDGPMAVLLAERDEVVPAELGRALYEAYDGPKRLWVQRGRGHNSLSFDPDEAWWEEAIAFLRSAGGSDGE